MNLIRYLLRSARGIVCYTTVTALLSGACNAGLIAMVNIALTNPDAPRSSLAWCFVGLGLGKLLATFLSQFALARYSQRATGDLRRGLIRKILAVPLRRLEKIGTPKIMVALTEDVMNISQALLAIPGFAGNVAILFGGAVYLGWLSWNLLLGLCGILALGTLIYRVLIVRGFEYLNLAREEEDRLFGYFRALTEGIKELKLNRARRASFVFQDVQSVTEACEKHNVSAEMRFIMAQGWNHLLFYALIGLILFLLPGFQRITPQALTGYVVTTLYLMGPLAGVLGSISVFTRANVALSKIERLGVSMSSQVTEEFSLNDRPGTMEYASLELASVTHSYHHEKDDNHFMLGPIDLIFLPGELIFLVGGNGSGKSTLAKIITGLYPPESGEIRLNGQPVTDRDRDDFRQIFSAVFADFHLFDNLAGASCTDLDSRAQFYLRQLHLDHKVKIANGLLSTTALSQGQRKRLTLLMAYLEDRPFYLFDEWASDQDPQFKEIFYHQLLPELKSRGKTVVVITHDDRYFPVADRIIKLDYGKIVTEEPAFKTFRAPVLELT